MDRQPDQGSSKAWEEYNETMARQPSQLRQDCVLLNVSTFGTMVNELTAYRY